MAEKKDQQNSEENNHYYAYSIENALDELSVDPEKGLDEEEVKDRREKFGENVLPSKKQTSIVELFLKQFKNFLILILFLAAGISIYAGQMANAYIIFGVILFNAIMGFIQEYKAEKAVKAIKSMVKHKAVVLRGGEEKTIKATEIVLGDIIELKEGQTVPADARLIEQKNLRTDEASLTGESEPVSKKTDKLKKDTALGNRLNMAWKKTHVVEGTGRAVVTAIGENTQIGQIAKSLQEMDKTESNFRKKTDRLAKKMAILAICTSAVVFALGFFYREMEFNNILLVTIATMVSSIPEGLPVIISIVLAIGANRMAKKHAIIREFQATEELGSVSSILTDKTGTITQSILTVKNIFTGDDKEYEVEGQGHSVVGNLKEKEGDKIDIKDDGEDKKALLKNLAIAAYCHNATLNISEEDSDDPEVKANGDPTEVALAVLGEKVGIKDIEPFNDLEEVDEIPFNSSQKFRANLFKYNDQQEMFVVGAPEKILELSSHLYTEGEKQELTDKHKENILQKNEEWAEQALRVIALAHKEYSGDQIEKDDVEDLVFTGMVGIIDPPREEVADAIAECKQAGIRVIMVTGDHEKTAAAIAESVGIIDKNEDGDDPKALSGTDVDELSDEELDEKVKHINVFARVSPNTKLRIAERLQKQGELIAMTGDGVNDAPALKKADVGIAMGQKGTDVAKDAAQIVLANDNFANIVDAVREGRIVFKNVKSTSYFLLTTNFASTATLMASLIMGLPIPLTAAQILWVNMVTDGIMDVAKSTEPGHGRIMEREPIKKDEPILKWSIMPYLLLMAAIMVTFAIAAFQYYLPQGEETARTGAFFVIAMTQVFNVYNMRDLKKSVFEIGFFSNKWINIAFVASIILQLAVVKIPFLQELFSFGDIPVTHFVLITVMSSVVLWAGELYKLVIRKMS